MDTHPETVEDVSDEEEGVRSSCAGDEVGDGSGEGSERRYLESEKGQGEERTRPKPSRSVSHTFVRPEMSEPTNIMMKRSDMTR